MSRPVILDNTVLSNLALVGQMLLVFRLWPERAASTYDVLDEYRVAAQRGLLPTHAWDELTVLELTEEEAAIAQGFSARLGAGERSCLAVAHHRNGLFGSDDADARAAAECLRVPVTGTVGILVLAVRRGMLKLPEANRLLNDLATAGYRSPVEELDALI